MKKSNFIALVLGTVSGMLFAVGMCMALIPEWNAFREGIAFGGAGLVLGLITVLVWRKMEHKQPLRLSGKTVGCVLVGLVGTLLLGAGLSLVTVWDKLAVGILAGILGIVVLLCLIPMTLGIKK